MDIVYVGKSRSQLKVGGMLKEDIREPPLHILAEETLTSSSVDVATPRLAFEERLDDNAILAR